MARKEKYLMHASRNKTIQDEMNENEMPPDGWNILLLSKTLWMEGKNVKQRSTLSSHEVSQAL